MSEHTDPARDVEALAECEHVAAVLAENGVGLVAEAERDGSFWVGGREVTRADYLALTGALEYGDDGFQSPAAHPRDLIDPLQQAMYDGREHLECPMLCELCGETLASTSCEHCNGSGCGPGTASGAYEECQWCAGAGRIHEGCAEQSYGELKARAERAEAALADLRTRVAALADRWDGFSSDVDDLLDDLRALLPEDGTQ